MEDAEGSTISLVTDIRNESRIKTASHSKGASDPSKSKSAQADLESNLGESDIGMENKI